MLNKRFFLTVMAFAIISPTQANTTASTPQDKLCIYTDLSEGLRCPEGELSYYFPKMWGSEQLPTRIASMFCNTNHQIIATEAGVLCTHSNRAKAFELAFIQLESFQEEEAERKKRNQKQIDDLI